MPDERADVGLTRDPFGTRSRRELDYPWLMVFAVALSLCPVLPLTGCGAGSTVHASVAVTTASAPSAFTLSPETATATQGSTLNFVVQPISGGLAAPSVCEWASNDSTVLNSEGSGTFSAQGVGSATVTATCDGTNATATATVSKPANPTSIVITRGGTYSGIWTSNDPNTPAVTIQTDEPVTISNSTITGKGTLIRAAGTNGLSLTLVNVTGTGSDPMVSGKARGKFLDATGLNALSVTHCTMTATSFGIYVAQSNLTSLVIQDNLGKDLDDRVSDGNGGTLLNQRVLGHFLQLNTLTVPNGGDISWNQYTSTEGVASVEDLMNFFDANGGTAAHPIVVHDNYVEGALATGFTNGYTGSGINVEGVQTNPGQASAWIQVVDNQVVHTASVGIAITAGHDNLMQGNRVVSCGKDSQGNFIDMNGYAMMMWDFYQTGSAFKNNQITGTTGGIVVDSQGTPVNDDLWIPSASAASNDVVSQNNMDHPCLASNVWTGQPERVEFTAWQSKLLGAKQALGDQH
jgi:hypothetical protein